MRGSTIRKYIQFQRDEGLRELLEMIASDHDYLVGEVGRLNEVVQLLAQNCGCTASEHMSGHKTGCTVEEARCLLQDEPEESDSERNRSRL